jgi:hypothetical protein
MDDKSINMNMNDFKNLDSSVLVSRLARLKVLARTDYGKAREWAEPLMVELNRRGELIAKRYGKKYSKVRFVKWYQVVPRGGGST